MLKILEFLGGLMFLVATIQFMISARQALKETYRVLVAPGPRIVRVRLFLGGSKSLIGQALHEFPRTRCSVLEGHRLSANFA